MPLSKNPDISRNLGTRHRAALGLTEQTDAFVVVISEENKSVGMVSQGKLSMNLDPPSLRKELLAAFDLKGRRESLEGAMA